MDWKIVEILNASDCDYQETQSFVDNNDYVGLIDYLVNVYAEERYEPGGEPSTTNEYDTGYIDGVNAAISAIEVHT